MISGSLYGDDPLLSGPDAQGNSLALDPAKQEMSNNKKLAMLMMAQQAGQAGANMMKPGLIPPRQPDPFDLYGNPLGGL